MDANAFEFYIDTCLPSLSLLPWLSTFLAFSPPVCNTCKRQPEAWSVPLPAGPGAGADRRCARYGVGAHRGGARSAQPTVVDAHAWARPVRLQDLLPLQGPADVRDRPSSAVPEQHSSRWQHRSESGQVRATQRSKSHASTTRTL